MAPVPSNSNDPFTQKKHSILSQISATSADNPDASPKGTLDVHLLDLINLINAHPDMVTTSSCSGRLSVFLEGHKQFAHHQQLEDSVDEGEDREKVGGKGQGGKWLFVTHEPREVVTETWWPRVTGYTEESGSTTTMTDSIRSRRYVLYKFEAMVSQTRQKLTHQIDLTQAFL